MKWLEKKFEIRRTSLTIVCLTKKCRKTSYSKWVKKSLSLTDWLCIWSISYIKACTNSPFQFSPPANDMNLEVQDYLAQLFKNFYHVLSLSPSFVCVLNLLGRKKRMKPFSSIIILSIVLVCLFLPNFNNIIACGQKPLQWVCFSELIIIILLLLVLATLTGTLFFFFHQWLSSGVKIWSLILSILAV